jgi:hypothetical protein
MVITYDFLGKYGQLGNQMFQYALLVGVKHKTNSEIIIDNEVRNTSYLFDFFDFKECTIGNFKTENMFEESTYHYSPEAFNINQDTNFRGYFQSEKYFKHVEDIVRSEFKFKEDLLDRVNSFLKQYEGKRLVSVHIRRGDYVIHQDAHPLCTIEYYNKAMDMLDGDDVMFICTSNDKEWCVENIKRDNIVYNYSELIHDMCLISQCDDHIIANSTFSWWGSWLGSDKNKKIIAPSVWYGERYNHWDTKDLYCENFIKI